jgi:hypothetical protein
MQNLDPSSVSYAGSVILRGDQLWVKSQLKIRQVFPSHDVGSVHGIARVGFLNAVTVCPLSSSNLAAPGQLALAETPWSECHVVSQMLVSPRLPASYSIFNLYPRW